MPNHHLYFAIPPLTFYLHLFYM